MLFQGEKMLAEGVNTVENTLRGISSKYHI